MNYYKVIADGVIIAVVSDYDFRRYQVKHSVVVVSSADDLECVQVGDCYYRDNWMKPCNNIPGVIPAVVEHITEDEYNSLKTQLDAGDIPDDGSLEAEEPVAEEPAEEGGEEVRKTAAQILIERIMSLEKQIGLADSDADMIADSNIVSGQFFAVGNNLYKATANIASGSKIVVGKNAVRKPISEALNEINA